MSQTNPTDKELQARLPNLTDQDFIELHKIERNYELSIENLKADIKINLDKWKSKVDIALLNNGYDIEEGVWADLTEVKIKHQVKET